MTKYSSGRKQRYTSTQVQFFVWERCTSIEKPMQSGKIRFMTSNSPTNTQIYFESMENQLNSRGKLSQDLQHCRFSKRFKTNWNLVKQVQNNFRKYLHVHVQRHGLDKERQFYRMLFEFPKGQELRKRFQLGHWSFLSPGDEEKWYGTQSYKPEGNGIPLRKTW